MKTMHEKGILIAELLVWNPGVGSIQMEKREVSNRGQELKEKENLKKKKRKKREKKGVRRQKDHIKDVSKD